MLRGASAEALADLSEAARVDAARWPTPRRSASELFGVARVLRDEPALRRVADRRVGRGRGQGRSRRAACSARRSAPASVEVLKAAVQRRWTFSRDLADALEHLGVARARALGGPATAAGSSDELFAVRQLVDSSPELRTALSDPARVGRRTSTGLLAGLLGGKTLPATTRLVEQAVVRHAHAPSTRRCEATRTSRPEHRGETVATVRTAQRARARPSEQRLARRARQAVRHARSTSTSSSTPTSSADCGSRSATTSSTAPSPAASTTPDAGSPADRSPPRQPTAPRTQGSRQRNMTELSIRPEEIRDALQKYVDGLQARGRQQGRGRHGRRGRRRHRARHRPALGDGQRAARVRGRHARHRAEPRHPRDRCRHPRRLRPASRRARRSAAPARSSRSPSATSYLGRVVDPLGTPIDGLGDIETDGRRALELQAPGVMAPQVGARAARHRHQGDRLDDPDRPRPAPADHRRPRDRQVDDRDRHDHQPEAELGVRRPGQAGPLHLRRDRPEGLDHRRGAWRARGGRRAGVHHDRGLPGVRLRGLQVPRAVHRLGHRPALDVRRQARPDRVRRPDQAGRGLPRRVAAAAPPAGP